MNAIALQPGLHPSTTLAPAILLLLVPHPTILKPIPIPRRQSLTTPPATPSHRTTPRLGPRIPTPHLRLFIAPAPPPSNTIPNSSVEPPRSVLLHTRTALALEAPSDLQAESALTGLLSLSLMTTTMATKAPAAAALTMMKLTMTRKRDPRLRRRKFRSRIGTSRCGPRHSTK